MVSQILISQTIKMPPHWGRAVVGGVVYTMIKRNKQIICEEKKRERENKVVADAKFPRVSVSAVPAPGCR